VCGSSVPDALWPFAAGRSAIVSTRSSGSWASHDTQLRASAAIASAFAAFSAGDLGEAEHPGTEQSHCWSTICRSRCPAPRERRSGRAMRRLRARSGHARLVRRAVQP
jgi:hypothetical protein